MADHINQSVLDYTGTDPGENLPTFAWPGGYPLVYYDAQSSELCADCANRPGYTDPVTGAMVHYEGPPIICDDCGTTIESAYGEVEE